MDFRSYTIFLGLLLLIVLIISILDSSSKGVRPHNTSSFTKYENFQGKEKLEPEQYDSNGGDKSIDPYSQLKGSPNCEPTPYSNSMGYLCYGRKEKELLQTRGGNQTNSASYASPPSESAEPSLGFSFF